jgi:hypothetical protein
VLAIAFWFPRVGFASEGSALGLGHHAEYTLQTIQKRFDAICLALLRREDQGDAKAVLVCFSGEEVDANNVDVEDLENAREQPPLFGCEYVKRPGHGGSSRGGMFEGKEKATNGGPLVAAGFHMRGKVYPPAPPDVWVIRMRATVVSA